MAIKKKFHSIKFSHMRDLIDIDLPEKLREITYVANCTTFRRLLINKYGRTDLDIDDEIANNTDTKLTYLGYKRFLESDLKYIFPRGAERTANGYRRDCKYLAKQMIIRGYVSLHNLLRLVMTANTVSLPRPLLALSRTLTPTTCVYPSTNR